MTFPKRINITGASGSGSTTLGQALAERTGIQFFDADDYYWLPSDPPYRSKRPAEERMNMLLGDLSRCEGAVLSGSVVHWGEALEMSFDLVVFLYIPHELRMARLLHRETRLFGTPNPEFMAWAARYDTGDLNVRSRELHEMWLAKLRCPVLRMEGDFTTEQRIESVLSEAGCPGYSDRNSLLS